jgi:hypothetical protein
MSLRRGGLGTRVFFFAVNYFIVILLNGLTVTKKSSG